MKTCFFLSLLLLCMVQFTRGNTCPVPYSTKCCWFGGLVGFGCEGPCWNYGCKTSCSTHQTVCQRYNPTGGKGNHECCSAGYKCLSDCQGSEDCCCLDKGNEIFRIFDIHYDMKKLEYVVDRGIPPLRVVQQAKNLGASRQPLANVETQITETHKTIHTFKTSTTINIGASISGKIPKYNIGGTLEMGMEQTWEQSEQQEVSFSRSVKISVSGQTIAAYSRQLNLFEARMIKARIPFKGRGFVANNCNRNVGHYEELEGVVELEGIAVFDNGQYTSIFGPQIPVECPVNPFDIPIHNQSGYEFCPNSGDKLCENNPICKRLGFTGVCCDYENSKVEPCCAIAAAHSKCSSFQPTRPVCPGITGNFARCCDIDKTMMQYKNNTTLLQTGTHKK